VKKRAQRGPARVIASAGEAIANVLALRGLTDQIRAQRVIAEWRDLVGERIASRTRPREVYDNALIVEVATSAWLHELNLLKPQLLAGLLERIGEPRLFERLELKLTGRTKRADTVVPTARRPAPPPRPPPKRATGIAAENIVKDVAAVDDEELRDLIARVRITHDK
jgi:predicted nucleic acid-binding Zn ribbon protein